MSELVNAGVIEDIDFAALDLEMRADNDNAYDGVDFNNTKEAADKVMGYEASDRSETEQLLIDKYGNQQFRYGIHSGTIRDMIALCPAVATELNKGFSKVVEFIDAYKIDTVDKDDKNEDDTEKVATSQEPEPEKAADAPQLVTADAATQNKVEVVQTPRTEEVSRQQNGAAEIAQVADVEAVQDMPADVAIEAIVVDSAVEQRSGSNLAAAVAQRETLQQETSGPETASVEMGDTTPPILIPELPLPIVKLYEEVEPVSVEDEEPSEIAVVPLPHFIEDMKFEDEVAVAEVPVLKNSEAAEGRFVTKNLASDIGDFHIPGMVVGLDEPGPETLGEAEPAIAGEYWVDDDDEIEDAPENFVAAELGNDEDSPVERAETTPEVTAETRRVSEPKPDVVRTETVEDNGEIIDDAPAEIVAKIVELIGIHPDEATEPEPEEAKRRITTIIEKIDVLERAETAEDCQEALLEVRVELAGLLALMGYRNADQLAEWLTRNYDIKQLRKYMSAILQSLTSPERSATLSTHIQNTTSPSKFGSRAVRMLVSLVGPGQGLRTA
ncbi:MAG: hypothetical protein JWO07_456 [Candidatus Saccharibacteria bacterium]|nr:hypothetical protein [Candidatus Saccharibacteria bacterium]